MSYVAYSGLQTPNQVLSKMVEYIKSRGYTVVQDITDDLNVYDKQYSDGKRFCFKDRTDEYFVILRTANGTQIFGDRNEVLPEPPEPLPTPVTDVRFTGIGMTVSEGYLPELKWYNQHNSPKDRTTGSTACVFMPMKVATVWEPNVQYHVNDVVPSPDSVYQCLCSVDHISGEVFDPSNWTTITSQQGYSYTLYCNNVTSPTDTLMFTLKKENDTFHQCTHLVFGNLSKYDEWIGGAFFSGSSVKSKMGNDVNVYLHARSVGGDGFSNYPTSDENILPILSSGSVSNTFLRIDIDEAPSSARGNIIWACSGTDNITGKRMSLPIRVGGGGNGSIPNYWYIQSHEMKDWGRNISTLNGITADLPIFAAVLVDPDSLNNYAAVGSVSGISFVSLLNMQAGCTYEKSYPKSDILDQVFPMGKRRGHYGFDGVSVSQQSDE